MMNNSAFHGTRLDVNHIAQVMEDLVMSAERRFGLNRYAIAPETVFMSHETFTPARGGSASAEVVALRQVFGHTANQIIVANTKGFTGHPMGVGIEDVIAVKILEYGIVPPIPNYKEVDPDLGALNFSRGGHYPVRYALHLAAGFGSQIAMTLTRRVPGGADRVENKPMYDRWLADVSGYDRAETEVVKRVLRIQTQGAPTRTPAPSAWRRGTGPTVRTVSGDGRSLATPYAPVVQWPAPMPSPIPAPAPVEPAGGNGHKPAGEPSPISTLPVSWNGKTAQVTADHPMGGAFSGETSDSRQQQATDKQPTTVEIRPQSTGNTLPITSANIAEKVLDIVAEKTGYPKDMLSLDLDLEADLGIDTVKQAETFAAIREEFSIPRRDNLKLRDYPTLARVIEYVRESKPELSAQPSPARLPSPASNGAGSTVFPQEPAFAGEQRTVVDSKQNTEPDRSQLAVVPADHRPPAAFDSIAGKVLEIVASKTGYPSEMLDLDLDLEADLGIDTVKQAEVFAAIREAFNIPRRDNLRLRDYTTLARVITFVKEGIGTQATATAPLAPTPDVQVEYKPGPGVSRPLLGSIAKANEAPRRVPIPVLRPALDLCKATGVMLNGNNRVVVMPDQAGIAQALISQLRELGVTPLILDPHATAGALDTQIKTWLSEGPVHGVYWLAALDVEPSIEAMSVENWRELNRVRVKNLYTVMRGLYESIATPGTFLISATRLGGLHGYNPEGATAPLGGAVTGFTKAYKRERTQALVKVVDFGDNAEIAPLLIAETLSDPGVVEVGYWNDSRFGIALEERPVNDAAPGMTLDRNSVIVVTGAAGGITSAIIGDLAAASGGSFYLLDLVPAPAPGDPHVALFRTDKKTLQARLIQEAQAEGDRPTPARIDKQILDIEREEAAQRAIESVEGAGGTAYYRAVNLLDGPAVTAIVDEIRQRHGHIDVIVHAGGLEISRALPDKDPQQFDLVFDVKADGFFHLLHAAQGMPIGATVVFSSVAGRFGNNGQTDYSAANDLLCKITSSLRRWRPETRGIAIDWTAWGGIGMATRGSIPKLMELAGIEMLSPESGVPTVRRELTAAGNFRGEILVAGRLGILEQEWDAHGGLDPNKATNWRCGCSTTSPMIGNVKAHKLYGGLEVETILDPSEQPFLYDHQMNGTPLLPGVMGIETFAELACMLAPDYEIAAVENVAFQRPFKFFRMQPQTLHLNATVHPAAQGELVMHARINSATTLPRAEMPPQEKVHFIGTARLTRRPIFPPTPVTAPTLEGMPELVDREAIYRLYFHGPAYRVLERVGLNGVQVIGLMAENLPPDVSPADTTMVMAPRLIELCFQTAGIWEIKRRGVMALPLAIRTVCVYRQPEPAAGQHFYATVEAVNNGAEFNARVLDQNGNVYVMLEGYRTIALG
ncbi:MAG: SDR family NAD(P)-dependent oxidoreductase [Anaerolineae bacterium]